MHLQESTLFDLDHTNVTMYPPHHASYAPAGFEVTKSKGLGGYAFTRKTLLDFDFFGSRSHKMLPITLRIVGTYAYAKLDVATSNGLG